MTLEYYLAYFSVVSIATVTPGPSMLLAINHGANHGLKRSLYSGVGNIIGNLMIAFVSLAGLRALLVASGTLFTFIKWIGIIYLIYIGVRMFMAPSKAPDTVDKRTAAIFRTSKGLFIDGFIISIANPKGLLFFTALFPQFIDVKASTTADFVILFATLGFIAFWGFMLYASFGSRINKLFRLHSFRKAYNRVTGSIFAGTGIAMAFSKD